ncbi:putative transcriptional regulator [Streptosporangium becharense]|uniref:Putative transcriptional regulator n=1 Tax=Streptosporangium becharense TaxID=1816182 RepID=A0A7W9IFD5_9ACTN|nr:BlaI/MecI/CopY family transcriptional regulator [Streptosporangium becharense]MBB2909376.1 putative transcriptional regulator [Streptosporangium becharense]MBB5819667.1 putative transcriptional regulator [Streptosporangium becharense]
MNLGSLERAIMDVLWGCKEPLLVRQVQDMLNDGAERPLAYTTVQTVAERLVRKGLLQRAPSRNAFRYTASHSRDEHVAGLMLDALAGSPDRAPVLSRFAERVDPDDALRLLHELARRAGERAHAQNQGTAVLP